MDAAIAALIGAGIGVVGSLGGAFIQQRAQSKREMMTAAVALGRADYEADLANAQAGGGRAILCPVDIYVAHHFNVLEAVAAGGYGSAEMDAVIAKRDALVAALERHTAGSESARQR